MSKVYVNGNSTPEQIKSLQKIITSFFEDQGSDIFVGSCEVNIAVRNNADPDDFYVYDEAITQKHLILDITRIVKI